MSKAAPARLRIVWSAEAKRNVRTIERAIALDILHCTDSYLLTGTGDVKRLKPPLTGYRLRCGDFRIFFSQMGEDGIAVRAVIHRKDAYR